METKIIDCFAGGGGASVGIEMALGRDVDIAINHDPKAILMHKTNHPGTLHLTEDIFKADLAKSVNHSKVSLLWGSPDCTSHSKAKGGQPRKNGLRILPWAVYKHAKAITPEVVIMENVEEIQMWGPLDEDGHPIRERIGEDYQKFIQAMQSIGYAFDSRELVAADYGAPTSRKRWYAIFRRDGKDIVWPEQTHSKDGKILPKWKECGNLVDWSDPGKSIFNRKKPLADATQKRIRNGIEKYVLHDPYLIWNDKINDSLHRYYVNVNPAGKKTVEAFTGKDLSMCFKGDHPGQFGIAAFLTKYYGTGCGQKLSDPLGTITTRDRFGLVSVVIKKYRNQWIPVDILLRMLKPEELKVMQGFPKDYIIHRDYRWQKYPAKEQVARIGNSVVPVMAQKLVAANCSYLKVGERIPNLQESMEINGQLRFA